MKRLLPVLLVFLILFLVSCEGRLTQSGGSETPESSSTSGSTSTSSGVSATNKPTILNWSTPVFLAPAGSFGRAYKLDDEHLVYGVWENSESSSTLYLKVFSLPDGTVVKEYEVYSAPKMEGYLSPFIKEVGGVDEDHVWVVYSVDGDAYNSTNYLYYRTPAGVKKLDLTNECGVKGSLSLSDSRNYGDVLYLPDSNPDEMGKTCVITFSDNSVTINKADTDGAFMYLVKTGGPLDFVEFDHKSRLVKVVNGATVNSIYIENGAFDNMEMGEDGYIYASKGEVTEEYVLKIDPNTLSIASGLVHESDANMAHEYVIPYSDKILFIFSKLDNWMQSTYKTWYAILDEDLKVVKEATRMPYTSEYGYISIAPAGYGVDSEGRLWTLAKSEFDDRDDSPIVVFDKDGNLVATSGSARSVSGDKLFFNVFKDKGVLIYNSSSDGNYYLIEYSMKE